MRHRLYHNIIDSWSFPTICCASNHFSHNHWFQLRLTVKNTNDHLIWGEASAAHVQNTFCCIITPKSIIIVWSLAHAQLSVTLWLLLYKGSLVNCSNLPHSSSCLPLTQRDLEKRISRCNWGRIYSYVHWFMCAFLNVSVTLNMWCTNYNRELESTCFTVYIVVWPLKIILVLVLCKADPIIVELTILKQITQNLVFVNINFQHTITLWCSALFHWR